MPSTVRPLLAGRTYSVLAGACQFGFARRGRVYDSFTIIVIIISITIIIMPRAQVLEWLAVKLDRKDLKAIASMIANGELDDVDPVAGAKMPAAIHAAHSTVEVTRSSYSSLGKRRSSYHSM